MKTRRFREFVRSWLYQDELLCTPALRLSDPERRCIAAGCLDQFLQQKVAGADEIFGNGSQASSIRSGRERKLMVLQNRSSPEEGDHGPRILSHSLKWESWKSFVSRLLGVVRRHSRCTRVEIGI
jgi:hypothetical protein